MFLALEESVSKLRQKCKRIRSFIKVYMGGKKQIAGLMLQEE